MLGQLRKKLELAQGRSEFVISVVCDIRGFSSFSATHESPDTAMFIKRFYLKLLGEYFAKAAFAKLTGDGLLLIFRYTEKTLPEVSDYVLSMCFKVVDDFPAMFKNDPMINFSTPARVGFGISRGPSCCLFSGRTILDYSGQLLNLAARLNDFARPKGIVIAGSYLFDVIPKSLRSKFKAAQAYVRGIAEERPIDVFYSSPDVTLPAYALHPITVLNWEAVSKSLTVAELKKLGGYFLIDLPKEPVSPDKTKMQLMWPNPKLPDYTRYHGYQHYEYFKDSLGHHLKFQLDPARAIVSSEGLTKNTKILFHFQFVPKAPQKKRQRRKKA